MKQYDPKPILYVKTGNRFAPMDWQAGAPVVNRIHATMFTRAEKVVVEEVLARSENAHLIWEWRE